MRKYNIHTKHVDNIQKYGVLYKVGMKNVSAAELPKIYPGRSIEGYCLATPSDFEIFGTKWTVKRNRPLLRTADAIGLVCYAEHTVYLDVDLPPQKEEEIICHELGHVIAGTLRLDNTEETANFCEVFLRQAVINWDKNRTHLFHDEWIGGTIGSAIQRAFNKFGPYEGKLDGWKGDLFADAIDDYFVTARYESDPL